MISSSHGGGRQKRCSTLLQVFMSADEPDAGSQETPSGEDSSPTMTTLVPSAALPQEERPLVEFDSPDSGLPSSRNYSVTSAHSQILSSIDDGQSTEEEGRSGGVLGGRQDSLTEDRLCSQLDKLVTNGAAADGIPPSLSSYTVRTEHVRLSALTAPRTTVKWWRQPFFLCADRAVGHSRPQPPQDRQRCAAVRPQLFLLHHSQPGETPQYHVQVCRRRIQMLVRTLGKWVKVSCVMWKNMSFLPLHSSLQSFEHFLAH